MEVVNKATQLSKIVDEAEDQLQKAREEKEMAITIFQKEKDDAVIQLASTQASSPLLEHEKTQLQKKLEEEKKASMS